MVKVVTVVTASGSHILLKLAMRSNVGQPVGQSRVFEDKNDHKVVFEVELFEVEVFHYLLHRHLTILK